jgi:Fe-S cluster biogenesis protein NfuA
VAEKLKSRESQSRIARIEELIQGIDALPDQTSRERTTELVQAILEMQGAALERLLELIYDSGPDGQAVIDRLGEDPLVSNLLLVHGLHPLDLETRVRNALEAVKPRLGLHGGSVELIGVTSDGGIKLRLEGNCNGCPSSRVTLKSSIEEAIYAAAPDVTGMEVEGAVDGFTGAVGDAKAKFTVCPTENGQNPTTGGIR